MGGRHSKQPVITNDLHEPLHDETDQQHCLACLFPPKGNSPTISSRHSSFHGLGGGSRNNSSSVLGGGDDGFGTPIPDTPEPIRRIRDAAMEKYYNKRDNNNEYDEEKKSSRGSFGRVGRSVSNSHDNNNYTRMSKFGGLGLEKESNSMYSDEANKSPRTPNGEKKPAAEIYHGAVSEIEIRRCMISLFMIHCCSFANAFNKRTESFSFLSPPQ